MLASSDFICVFQPIFDAQKEEAVAYEALTRVRVPEMGVSPQALFDLAYEYGLLVELELCCFNIAVRDFMANELTGQLFINFSPLVIERIDDCSDEIAHILNEVNFPAERVVIEVTERYEAKNQDLLREKIQKFRERGMRVAIDDLGTGHSGLKKWVDLAPDIVKVDRYFVKNCHDNIVKRELIRTIFELGRATGVSVIAEGIEHEEDYIFLKKLGMKYAQGYFLGKPTLTPSAHCPKLTQDKLRYNASEADHRDFELGKLVNKIAPVSSFENCKSVYSQFKLSPDLKTLVVINKEFVPIGLVYRSALTDILSSDYGHALYDKQPITKAMQPVNLTVDLTASLDEVSKLITDNPEFDYQPEFIITSDGKYAGLASVRSILKLMTAEKIMHAQQANPLTMLPGNIVIERNINQLIKRRSAFELAYFDLDNFKPYNDIYGYAAGDQVIKLVAEILSDSCNGNFIAHVGGDDFVVVFQQSDALGCCQNALDIFEERILAYFEPLHISQKGYFGTDREGAYQLIPLLSLSCGVIRPDISCIHSIHDVSVLAGRAKKRAKLAGRNEVIVMGPLLVERVS